MTCGDEAVLCARIIDALVLLVLVEAVVLVLYWRRSRRGIEPCAVIGLLGAGLFLMLAIRAVLMNAPMTLLALLLLGSLLCHVGDLLFRWKRPG